MPKKKMVKKLHSKKKKMWHHKKFFIFLSAGLGVIFILAVVKLLVFYHTGVLGASTSEPMPTNSASYSYHTKDNMWTLVGTANYGSYQQGDKSSGDNITYTASLTRSDNKPFLVQISCRTLVNGKLSSPITPDSKNYRKDSYFSLPFGITPLPDLKDSFVGGVCSAWYQTVARDVDDNGHVKFVKIDNPISFVPDIPLGKADHFAKYNNGTQVVVAAYTFPVTPQKKKPTPTPSPKPFLGKTKGFVDTISAKTCTAGIQGWACEVGVKNKQVQVDFYDGPYIPGRKNKYIGSVSHTSSINAYYLASSSDQKTINNSVYCNDSSNTSHRYVFHIPPSLQDGRTHHIYGYINVADNKLHPMGNQGQMLMCKKQG